MATTVEEVANAVLGSVASEAGLELVATWLSERYRELTNKARFRHLLRHAELTMPAVISDGEVTLTVGSDTIVGDTDARAAWAALGDTIVGQYIRVEGERTWYEVAGLDGSGDILLVSEYTAPFLDADPPTDAGYRLVQRFLPLAADCRWIGVVRHQRLHEPLEEVAHQELDEAMPSRILVADIPQFWAEQRNAANGRKQIEVVPYARTAQVLNYTYYAISPQLTLDDELPLEIDSHILKQGAFVDLCRWEMGQAAKMNRPEMFASWRNEMNSAMTRWDEKIREAVKADRSSDTISLQMNTQGFPTGGDRLVRNAYDYVYVRGRRP